MLDFFLKLKADNRGAVTIFITLILIPSIAFTGFFVDFARVKMYQSQAVTSCDSYADSVLSYYDGLLQDIYGLYGITQTDALTNAEDNLKTCAEISFDPTKSYSEEESSVKTLLSKFVGTNSTEGYMPYSDADVSFSYSKVDNMNLGNSTVLENQITDFSKYICPINMVKSAVTSLNSSSSSSNSTSSTESNTDDDDDDDSNENAVSDLLEDENEIESTSADSDVLDEKMKLDTEMVTLNSICKEYYEQINLIRNYSTEKYLNKAIIAQYTEDTKNSILGKINQSLIDKLNGYHKEIATNSQSLLENKKELDTTNASLDELQNTSDYNTYSDNQDIDSYNQRVSNYNKNHTENGDFNATLGSYTSVAEQNKEIKKYNSKVDNYNSKVKDNTSKVKKMNLEYEDKNFVSKLKSLESKKRELEIKISDLNSKIEELQTKINSAIDGIDTLIKDFNNTENWFKQYDGRLTKLQQISERIYSEQLRVKSYYNACLTALNDTSVSEEVRTQVSNELEQIKPLIDYDFTGVTLQIVDPNQSVIESHMSKVESFYGYFSQFLTYTANLKSGKYVNELTDSDGNVTGYTPITLTLSDYIPTETYDFTGEKNQEWIDLEVKENEFVSIEMIKYDNGNKTTESCGIYTYLKKSYNTATTTSSKTPTSESDAQSKVNEQSQQASSDFDTQLNAFIEKCQRSIPDEFYSSFNNGDIATAEKLNADSKPSMQDSDLKSLLGDFTISLYDKLLVEEYCYNMFSNVTTKEGKESLTYVPMTTNVNYLLNGELEYIYVGNQSSSENIRTVLLQILALRFGLDFISTYKISAINTAINAIRDSVSLALTPVVGVLVAAVVRIGVALVMAFADVCKLMETDASGNYQSVVFFQTSLDDVSLNLNSYLSGFSDNVNLSKSSSSSSSSSKLAFKYTDYLRVLMLMFGNTEKMVNRAGNLIELNINNYTSGTKGNADGLQHTFYMSNALTMVEATVSVKTNFLFSDFYLTDSMIPDSDTKASVETFTKQGYTYSLKRGY